LAAIGNNLQRIRELSVQSANATNSASDRTALQLEVSELIAEIDRVASTSAFNGVKLLDGSFASQAFQVGANAGETVSISSIASSRTADLGQANTASATGGAIATAGIASGELTVNGNTVAATTGDAALIASAIGASSSDVTATATNAQTAITYANVVGTAASAATAGDTGSGGVHTTSAAASGGQIYSLTVDGTAIFSETAVDGTSTVTAAEIDLAIGALETSFGGASGELTANLSFTGTAAGGDLVFSGADGEDFDVVVVNTFSTTAGGFAGSDFATGTNTITAGTPAVAGVAPTYTLSIDGAALDFTADGADGTITAAEVGALIDALDGYTASGTGTTLSVTKADGSNIVFSEAGSDSNASEGLVADGSSAAATETYRGTVAVTSTGGDLVIAGSAPGNAGLTAGTTTAALAGTTIAATDISTVAGANAAIASADAALTRSVNRC